MHVGNSECVNVLGRSLDCPLSAAAAAVGSLHCGARCASAVVMGSLLYGSCRRNAWWRTQPVSNLSPRPISLLTGIKNRESLDFRALRRNWDTNFTPSNNDFRRTPCESERGIWPRFATNCEANSELIPSTRQSSISTWTLSRRPPITGRSFSAAVSSSP